MKDWHFAQPEATGSNDWAGKALVAGLHLAEADRIPCFREDDAHLIAAAPNLLSALEDVAESYCMKTCAQTVKLSSGIIHTWECRKASDAIKKAKGTLQ